MTAKKATAAAVAPLEGEVSRLREAREERDDLRSRLAAAEARAEKAEGEAARLGDMRAWAMSRIEECRREEARFPYENLTAANQVALGGRAMTACAVPVCAVVSPAMGDDLDNRARLWRSARCESTS